MFPGSNGSAVVVVVVAVGSRPTVTTVVRIVKIEDENTSRNAQLTLSLIHSMSLVRKRVLEHQTNRLRAMEWDPAR